MRFACRLVSLAVVVLLTGCAGGTAPMIVQDSGSMEFSKTEPAAPMPPAESLFKEDEKVISNEDILRILAAKIAVVKNAKIAVVRAGRLPYWYGWSEDFTRLNREIDKQFLDKMRSSQRVREVVYLPTMAMPRDMTIPYLRQSGARFQADMVLVYRTFSRTYDKQKMFGADETRAYCTLEALLIDTRTGVIPFSAIVTEDFSAKKERGDVDFSETVAKAEQQAIAKAQLQMADELVRFFSTLTD